MIDDHCNAWLSVFTFRQTVIGDVADMLWENSMFKAASLTSLKRSRFCTILFVNLLYHRCSCIDQCKHLYQDAGSISTRNETLNSINDGQWPRIVFWHCFLSSPIIHVVAMSRKTYPFYFDHARNQYHNSIKKQIFAERMYNTAALMKRQEFLIFFDSGLETLTLF